MPEAQSSAPTSAPLPNEPLHKTAHRVPWVPLISGLVALLLIAGGVYVYTTMMPAKEPAKPKHIGIISFRQFNDVEKGFRQEMARIGYADATYEQYISIPGPTMMDDINRDIRLMVEHNVDAIWASLEMQAKTAVDVTNALGRSDIPVVFMTRFHDPVEFGIIKSFASSGNNSTGVATNLEEIVQRNLQFLKDINPNFKKLGVFTEGFMVDSIGAEYFKTLKEQAPLLGIQLVEYKTSAPPPQAEAEFNRIAATIKKGDIDGLFHIGGHFYGLQEKGESELAVRLGIPMVAPFEDLPNGGTFSYSDDFGTSGKITANILDRIFKGTKPSDIPIEYGSDNILTLMTGRAKQAGVTFPDSMLYLAKNKFDDNSAFETESLNH